MTPASATEVRAAVDAAYRDDGASVAWLTRQCGGDLGLAEDAMQDALAAALTAWGPGGIPDIPVAWLRTTARRKAIDRVRRDRTGQRKHELAERLDRSEDNAVIPTDEVTRDDQLTLIFTCCHPALRTEAQVALALKSVCGLSTTEIAQGFLVAEATMAQRLVRAKKKIAAAGIPFRTPSEADMPDRLASVLGVVYLVFTEGYVATSGEALIRTDLCAEAIRLGRVLTQLMPDEPEATGLLALLLLQHSRRAARVDDSGNLVRLEDQNRQTWDLDQIGEALALLTRAARQDRAGQYVLQASIAACHASAASPDDTDWHRIKSLYDRLLVSTGSPVVALNRTVAVHQAEGPRAALDLLDELAGETPAVQNWHLFHLARAEYLRDLGRASEARQSYEEAMEKQPSAAERRHIEHRSASLE